MVSPHLSQGSPGQLRWQETIPLTPNHWTHLAWHRTANICLVRVSKMVPGTTEPP